MRYSDEVRLESFIDGRDGWSDLILRGKKERGPGSISLLEAYIQFSCIPERERERERERFPDISVGRNEKIK